MRVALGSGLLGSGSVWFRRVGDVLFPEPAAPQRPTRTGVAGYLLGFLAAVGYLLVIPSGRSHLDRVWAEDGVVFMAGAYRGSLPGTAFTPYAGYLHLLPRLTAEAVSHLPLTWWACGLAVSAAVLRAAMATLVHAATAGHVRSRVLRLAIASTLVLLPAGNNEAIGNVANLHWFVVFAGFWVLLWRPAYRWQAAVAAVAMVLFTTTTPLGVLFLPLAALRLVLPRPRDRAPAVAVLLGLAANLVPMAAGGRPHDPLDLPAVLASAAARGPLVTFTGSEWAAHLYPRIVDHPAAWPAALAAVAVLGLAAVAVVRGPAPRRVLVLACLLYGGAVLLLSLSQNWVPLLRIDWPGVVLANQRYSAGACPFFLTAVVLGLAERFRGGWRYPVLAARVAVLAVLAAGTAYQWRADTAPLHGITWGRAVAAARQECAAGRAEVLVQTIPARELVPIRCRDLPPS